MRPDTIDITTLTDEVVQTFPTGGHGAVPAPQPWPFPRGQAHHMQCAGCGRVVLARGCGMCPPCEAVHGAYPLG